MDETKTLEQREVRNQWKNLGIKLFEHMGGSTVSGGSTLQLLMYLMKFVDTAETNPTEVIHNE